MTMQIQWIVEKVGWAKGEAFLPMTWSIEMAQGQDSVRLSVDASLRQEGDTPILVPDIEMIQRGVLAMADHPLLSVVPVHEWVARILLERPQSPRGIHLFKFRRTLHEQIVMSATDVYGRLHEEARLIKDGAVLLSSRGDALSLIQGVVVWRGARAACWCLVDVHGQARIYPTYQMAAQMFHTASGSISHARKLFWQDHSSRFRMMLHDGSLPEEGSREEMDDLGLDPLPPEMIHEKPHIEGDVA